MKAKSLLIGFISGFTVAGVSVLLSTPNSGKELRLQLKHSKDETMDILHDLKGGILQLKEECVSATTVSKTQIQDFVKGVKEALEDWKQDSQVHTNAIQVQINDVEIAIQELETAISPLTTK
jgi:gas vesicle protein